MTTSTTAIQLMVTLHASAACPLCGKKVEERRVLPVDATTSGALAVKIEELDVKVRSTLASRGWTPEMCGACRDKDPADRNRDERFAHQLRDLDDLQRRAPYRAKEGGDE